MSGFSEDVISTAAGAVGGQENIQRRPRQGIDVEARWEYLRGAIARAFISDTDLILYGKMLLHNRLRKSLQILHHNVGNILVAMRGISRTTTLPSPAAAQVSLQKILRAVDPRGLASSPREELLKYSKSIVRATSIDRQVFPVGKEAANKLDLYLTSFVENWTTTQKLFSFYMQGLGGTPALARTLAAKQVGAELSKTLEVVNREDVLTDYAVKLAGGFSALDAASRDFEYDYRVRIEGLSKTPHGISVEYVKEGSDLVALKLRDSEGELRPAMLGIRTGDVVYINGGQTTTVSSVTATQINCSPIEFIGAASLLIAPAGAAIYRAAVVKISDTKFLQKYADLPTKIKNLRGPRTSDRQLLGNYIYQFAADFFGDDTDLAIAAANVEVSAVIPAVSIESILAIPPTPVTTSTFAAGREMLRTLRSNGFSRAAERFVLAGPDELLRMSFTDASYHGKTSKAVSDVMSFLQEA